jgi:AbrB family looped-hinge helix DNA binding protein
MALVKLSRSGRVTLPVEARRALDLAPGDWLDAEVVEGGLLLKPRAKRERGLERMLAAKRRVQPTPEQAAKSPEQQEREIFDEVRAMRHEHAQGRPR